MRPRFLALPSIVLLAACGSPGSTGSPAPGGNGAPPAVAVTLDAQNFRFSPALVTARPGDVVMVTVNNKDSYDHNFSIAELKVNKDIPKGTSASVTFTATGSTNLQFFCEYHRSKGMVGSLGLGGSNSPAVAPSAASTDKPYGSGY
jgi:plastocyanin